MATMAGEPLPALPPQLLAAAGGGEPAASALQRCSLLVVPYALSCVMEAAGLAARSGCAAARAPISLPRWALAGAANGYVEQCYNEETNYRTVVPVGGHGALPPPSAASGRMPELRGAGCR